MPPAKEVAKNIRKELKERFPNQKFSVRVGSGRGSVNIAWKDGVSTAKVEEIARKYENVYYDEFSQEVIGGYPYVFTRRDYSPQVKDAVKKSIIDRFAEGTFGPDPEFDPSGRFNDEVWRTLRVTDFSPVVTKRKKPSRERKPKSYRAPIDFAGWKCTVTRNGRIICKNGKNEIVIVPRKSVSIKGTKDCVYSRGKFVCKISR